MKKRNFLLLFSLAICQFSFPLFAASDLESGVKELAQQISKNMIDSNKKKIAVIEFSNLNDEVTHFGQFLAEELITNLFLVSPGQFEVVERRQLVKILNEHDLGASGLLDADAMEKVGKILGVDAIVTGSVSDLGNKVKLNARLISVDTAKIFAVAFASIPKIDTVKTLMNKMPKSVKSENLQNKESNNKKLKKTGKETITKSLSANGINFDLEKCVRSNSKLECLFTIKAIEKDNYFTLYGVHRKGNISLVYDDKGLEKRARQVMLADENNPKYLQRLLIKNIPTKVKIVFDDLSINASKIALLRLRYHSGNAKQYAYADFRDVAFLNK